MYKDFYKVMLVTQKGTRDTQAYLKFVEECIHGGITSVQLREKHASDEEIISFGKQLKNMLGAYNIPLIINDSIKLALTIQADGVHLGQSDGSIQEAREILGDDALIGCSMEEISHIEKANLLPINYVGIGPIFPSNNKKDAKHIWGCTQLQQAVSKSQHPTVAIGGITLENIPLVKETGVQGIAAIGLFHDSTIPNEASKQLFNLFGGI